MAAAADRLNRIGRDIPLFVQQFAPRNRPVLNRKITVLMIEFLIAPCLVIAQELRECLLGKAREYDIRMLCSLVREHGRMHPAEKHGLALFPEIVCVGIAAGRRAGDAGNADQLRINFKGDLSGCFVIDHDLRFQLLRYERSERGQRQRGIVQRFSEAAGKPVHGARRCQ